jgi:hypothetical protein
VKEVQLSMVAVDPRMYSTEEDTESAQGEASIPGAAFPWSFPVDFGGGSGATLAVSAPNSGNYPSPPLIRVLGPATSIQLTNAATDESLFLEGMSLSAGEWVEVDFAARTAVREDGTNVYDRVAFPGSKWWSLVPGSNTVQLWATGTDDTTGIDVVSRAVFV